MFFKFIFTVIVSMICFGFLRKNWAQIWTTKIQPFLESINARATQHAQDQASDHEYEPISNLQAEEIRQNEKPNQ